MQTRVVRLVTTDADTRAVILLLVLAAPTFAGCMGERVEPAGSAEAIEWPVGATWVYQYGHHVEKTGVQGGETRTSHASDSDTVQMTVIDHGQTPHGIEAVALAVEGQDGTYAGNPEVLPSGVYLLDARTHEPLAGPRGRHGWDTLCSRTMVGAVVPFWPVRLPLEPETARRDVLRGDVAHVSVRGVAAVETTAGRFEATRIEVTLVPLPPTDQYRRVTFWYSHEVGNIVLMERDYMFRNADVTVYERATMELSSFSLQPDEEARRNVPVLVDRAHHHGDAASSALGQTYARIVSDQPEFVRLDDEATIRFALYRTYLEFGAPDHSRQSVHSDIYSLGQEDWGGTEIVWSTKEGDRPWREAGSGPGITTTTTNVTRLQVRADLLLGNDLLCLNGSSQREQVEFLTRSIVYEWAGAFDVPAGVPAQMPVLDLPTKAGSVEARLNWTVTSVKGSLLTESGHPVASCQHCTADAVQEGRVSWLVWEDTPFPVYWQPAGFTSAGMDAPVTAGQTVHLSVLMSSVRAPF